jgi:F-type H+-transporting ATPase subunit b
LALPALWADAAFGSEGGGGLYFGDIGQALAALAVFLVLLAILGKWAWKPIVEQLRAREQRIEKAIADAERRRQEAHELAERYRQRMERVEAEAEEALARTRQQADLAREEVLTAARSEAQGILRDARRQIEQARDEALREIQETTAKLAADIAVAALGRRLTEEDHRRLVEESLREISQRASGGRP